MLQIYVSRSTLLDILTNAQPFVEEDFPVVQKMPRFDNKSGTTNERADALKAILFLEVKKHLLVTR